MSSPDEVRFSSCCNSPFRGVKLGHVNCLKKFSASQLSEVDLNGESILHLAARLGDEECTKFIAEHMPALLDFENRCAETPLLTAVGFGHQKLVEEMLNGPFKDSLRRALHRDVNGTSCLMAAVAQRNNDLALWLLRRFGKPLASQSNSFGMLPLHVAVANGNIEFIRIVTKYDGHMVNVKDHFGCTPIIYAAQGGCLSSLRYMVEKLRCDVWSTSAKGQTILHVAALCGHAHIVKWFISRAGIEAMLHTTEYQSNAVHCASFAGHLPVLRVLLDPWPRKKRRQLLTIRDSRGNTPLHLAAINCHIDVALYLLDNDANPELTNGSGQSVENIAQIRNCYALAMIVAGNSHDRNKWVKSAKSCTDLYQTLTRNTNGGATRRFSAPYAWSNSYQRPITIQNLQPVTSGLIRTSGSMGCPERNRSLRTLSDEGTQTDMDLLIDHVKLIDESWLGEATAAVEEIDKVLVSEMDDKVV